MSTDQKTTTPSKGFFTSLFASPPKAPAMDAVATDTATPKLTKDPLDDAMVSKEAAACDKPATYKRSGSEAEIKQRDTVQASVKKPKRDSSTVEHQDDDDDADEPFLPLALNWRTHTELSDWTIEVAGTPVATSPSSTAIASTPPGHPYQRYQVHRSVISLESKYFQALLTKSPSVLGSATALLLGRGSGMTIGTSRFVFCPEAAALFPTLLDYMYAPWKLALSTETAAIFYYFGQYFDMPRLKWDAKQFWMNDLTIDTVATYYRHAVVLDNRKLVQAISTACARDEIFSQLTADSVMLQVPRVDVWLDLAQQHLAAKMANGGQGSSSIFADHSKRWSILMATFLQKHYATEAVVNWDIFGQLTDESTMPVIDPSVALILLDLECCLQEEQQKQQRTAITSTTPTSSKKTVASLVKKETDIKDVAVAAATGLSSLQNRCIAALEQTWDTMDLSSLAAEDANGVGNTSVINSSSGGMHGSLRRQSSQFILTLFHRTLTAAQQSTREKAAKMDGLADASNATVAQPKVLHPAVVYDASTTAQYESKDGNVVDVDNNDDDMMIPVDF